MSQPSPGTSRGAVPHKAPKNNLSAAFGRTTTGPGGGGALSRLGGAPVAAAILPRSSEPAPPPEQTDGVRTTWVPVTEVALNPLNDRDPEDYTDLSDLTSMQTLGQHTACGVVTAAAFLRLFPLDDDDPEYRAAAEAVSAAKYVVVMGTRRRVAAEAFELGRLKVEINDTLAQSRGDFIAYVASENLDRRNLTLLQEARVVDRLAKELGSGTAAGERLKKSRAWVSQRRSILKLVPELQELVRQREILIEDARHLGSLAPEEQLVAWRQIQAKRSAEARLLTAVNEPEKTGGETGPAKPRRWRFTETQSPREVSELLLQRFEGEDLAALIDILTAARI